MLWGVRGWGVPSRLREGSVAVSTRQRVSRCYMQGLPRPQRTVLIRSKQFLGGGATEFKRMFERSFFLRFSTTSELGTNQFPKNFCHVVFLASSSLIPTHTVNKFLEQISGQHDSKSKSDISARKAIEVRPKKIIC